MTEKVSDVFVEHMIKQQTTVRQYCIRGAAIVGVLVVSVLTLLILYTLLPLTVFLAVWGARAVFRATSYEFEYIVTNGELDVDRIMGRRSRKRVLTVNCKDFEILAPVKPEYTEPYNTQPFARRINAAGSPKSQARYFAVFKDRDGANTLLIFEPDERMLKAFRVYIPRKIKN